MNPVSLLVCFLGRRTAEKDLISDCAAEEPKRLVVVVVVRGGRAGAKWVIKRDSVIINGCEKRR